MGERVVDNILDLIGGTPIIKLSNVVPEGSAAVWAKLENLNPAGSVKERICLRMIEAAEKAGAIEPGKSVIVEPTSGNTGIGLALVCAVKGYRLILTMPDDMSLERRQLLTAYGAELVLTPAPEQMEGALRRAEELLKENPGSFMPQQFRNRENPAAHREGTGPEILEQMEGGIDAFVAGVGTGGTMTGVGEILRRTFPGIYIAAVEPEESAVLSGGRPRVHEIQGIGAGFVPEILNREIYDEVIRINGKEAKRFTRELALREGLLIGISAGAAGAAALKVAKKLGKGKNVVTIFCDTGERYLSTGLFDNA
jgi:cysteine synthase A